MDQDLVLQEVKAFRLARLRLQSNGASIAIAIWRMERAGLHWAEAAPLDRLTGRQRQRAERAAVEAAEKRDHPVTPGGVSSQLDRGFDRLRSRVREERSLVAGERRDLVELLTQANLWLVVEVRPRHVQELLRLIDDGRDDVGMGMAGGVHRDAGGAIEEEVPVDVFNHGASAARHDKGIAPRVRRGHYFAVSFNDRSGLRPWEGCNDRRFVHVRSQMADC